MSTLLLSALAGIVVALLALGPLSLLATPSFAPRVTLALCGIGAALALAGLVTGAAPSLAHPRFGPPGIALSMALDGLSALFLLLLFIVGAACAGSSPVAPVLIGAVAATMLAADGFSLVLGFAASNVALAALLLGGPGRIGPAAALVATLALTAAMALLAPAASELGFAAIRAHPPQGGRAVAVLALTLIGAGGAYSGRWLRRALASAAGPTSALLIGAAPTLGLYLLIRVLVDLAGPAQPGWWGGVLVLLGAGGALLGAARMMAAADLRAFAAREPAAPGGLAVIAIGLALVARAADLAPLASLALAAACLLAVARALGGTLLSLVLAAAEAGAGTRRLDRLGGLSRGMPRTTACALAAGASLAALPPSLGFAGVWALVQALIGAARVGGLGWQAVATLAMLGIAASVTLGAIASVRLVGIGFLGRPRTPRAAAAQEPRRPAQIAMLSLAALTLAAGLFPGVIVRMAASASRGLLGADLADRAGWFTLAPLPEAPGLTAAALAALLLLITLATLRARTFKAPVGQQVGPPWEGGGEPPPPWLPFGDPATQIGPQGFAAPVAALPRAAMPRLARRLRPLLRVVRRLATRPDRARPASVREALAALLAVAAALLAYLLAEQA